MNWKEMLSYFNLTALPFGKEIPTKSLQLLPLRRTSPLPSF